MLMIYKKEFGLKIIKIISTIYQQENKQFYS